MRSENGVAVCPECGLSIPHQIGVVDEPRPPKNCPRCKYSLAELKHDGVVAVCPDCGLSMPLRVPDFGRPMRCAHCRTTLTGMPIFAMRVRCPTCGLLQWWRGPPRRSRSLGERVLIWTLLTFVLAPVALCVLSFVFSIFSAAFGFGP